MSEKRKKILLVDDSGTALMMEKMILSKEPYDLITAKNGETAIATAEAERPDLILCDVVMPEMNGFEVLARLRQIDHLAEVPVIMVTTRGEAENLERGYQLGCTDYVTKPIDGVELVTKVRSYLGIEAVVP